MRVLIVFAGVLLTVMQAIVGIADFGMISRGDNHSSQSDYIQLTSLNGLKTDVSVFKDGWVSQYISPDNILVLNYSTSSWNGAYGDTWNSYANYDLKTKKRIDMKALFGKNLSEAEAKIKSVMRQQIVDIINEDNQTLTDSNFTRLDRESAVDQMRMYQHCLYMRDEYGIEIDDFYFNKSGIIFTRDRCAPWALRAIDDLDTYGTYLSFEELSPYFTKYAKDLIANKDKIVKKEPQPIKHYAGALGGKYPIVVLEPTVDKNGAAETWYWYEKIGVPIKWSGKKNGDEFVLKENKTASVKFKIVGDRMIGEWTNLKTQKSLPFNLPPKQ